MSIFARTGLRLPSDLTDAKWAVLEPLLPSRSTRGPPPLWTYRDIMEALLYLLHGGLPWRMVPPDVFPSMTTVQHYFYELRDLGLWLSINHALLMMIRETVGREASPGVPPVKWSMFWDNFIPRYGGSKDDSQTGKGRRHSYEASAG